MKKTLAFILALVMMATLFAGCGGSAGSDSPSAPASSAPAATDNQSPEPSQVDSTAVTIGFVGTHDSSYPSATNSNDFITQMMIYDKLFESDDHTKEIKSRVLENWEWVDDVTLKLVLRQDIYFSDGKQATGEDMLYSIHSYTLNGERTDKYMYYKNIDFDQSYVDEDGFTVYLVWQQPYSQALINMDCCLMEKEFLLAHDEADSIWFSGPVGSGPYKIADYEKNAYIKFELREDYWNKDYSYDATEITLRFYTDETAMYVDYQNGVIDAMYNVSGTIVDQVEAAGNQGTVNYVSQGAVCLLNLNEGNEFLSNPKVREAVAYALDMNAISQIAFGSLYRPATSHFPSDFEVYKEHEGYTYDPEHAAAALAESGYSGSDITLHFIAVNDGVQPKIAEVVQGYLAVLGINVTIETADLGTALPMFRERDKTAVQFMVVNGGNPMRDGVRLVADFGAESFVKCRAIYDEGYNELAQKAMWTTDQDEINAACEALDDWLYDNYFCLPVCEQYGALVYNSRITSFDQSSILRSCLGSLTLK